MGLTMVIKCPKCDYKAKGRLGMGEEGLGGAYQAYAAKELDFEHPDHGKASTWKFIRSKEWLGEEEANSDLMAEEYADAEVLE